MSSYKEDILRTFEQDLPWEILSGANILVTGATGLIGGCLVDTLMMNPRRDYQMYASGRNEDRARARFRDFAEEPAFHFVKYDVMQPLDSDARFDFIIHAASNASPNFFAQKPVEVIKSNIDGVANLMEVAMWIARSHVLVTPHLNVQRRHFVCHMPLNTEQMWS